MKYFSLFFLFINIVFNTDIYAFVTFDIHLIHKRGVDEGLVLVSELHSQENLLEKRPIDLIMNDGTILSFSISSIEPKEMKLSGYVVFPDGLKGTLKESGIQKNGKYTYSIPGREGEVIELVVIPFAKNKSLLTSLPPIIEAPAELVLVDKKSGAPSVPVVKKKTNPPQVKPPTKPE